MTAVIRALREPLLRTRDARVIMAIGRAAIYCLQSSFYRVRVYGLYILTERIRALIKLSLDLVYYYAYITIKCALEAALKRETE